MLQAKYLMIGDWVLVCRNKTNEPVRLRSEDFCHWKQDGLYAVETIKCTPIPLTSEILEKNGMRVFNHRNPWQGENLIKKWYSKDGKFYVSHYRVGNMFTYTVGNGVSRICGIRYVHELQHALRLCGIEKEIII